MFQIKAKIVDNKKVGDNYFRLSIEAAKIIREARPGQFIEVKVSGGYEPLLRRPFSIHRIGSRVSGRGSRRIPNPESRAPNTIDILYEVVGKGTQILAQKRPGEYLDVIGPLGNGFDYRTPNPESRTPILVAGGMGVAPLLFLAEKLIGRTPNPEPRTPIVLIGAKTKSHIVCANEFKNLGCEVKIATDDGSRGFKGKVTDLLKNLLSTIDYRLSTIYACGPVPMLKEISRISQDYAIPAQVSLEAHMACGIGACLGCVVETREGFKRVCKEGPVFKADEIIW